MILTVTSNIALDRTYLVDHVNPGAVHKVRTAFSQTGGKGINVSRTLAALGHSTLVAGLLGRAGLDEAQADLQRAGLSCELYGVGDQPRKTVTVTSDDGITTTFDEPGPTVTEAEWRGFEDHVRALVPGAETVVIAGSFPPGTPADGLERLVTVAREQDVPVMVDARGPKLSAALGVRPEITKLNLDELGQTLGRECLTDREVIEGAQELQDAGARTVIVTLGGDGAIALDGEAGWRVQHPRRSGNPVGAGDAFSAGFTVARLEQREFGEALRHGAAAALASLLSPVAGRVGAADVRAAIPEIEIKQFEVVRV